MITKPCPNCKAIIGRTLRTCPNCGYAFVAKNTWRAQKMAERGGPQKPGRKPKFDMDAPEPSPELKLLELAEPKMQIPEAARFVVSRTKEGGLQLSWPDFGVQFTLSPAERMIVRSVA